MPCPCWLELREGELEVLLAQIMPPQAHSSFPGWNSVPATANRSLPPVGTLSAHAPVHLHMPFLWPWAPASLSPSDNTAWFFQFRGCATLSLNSPPPCSLQRDRSTLLQASTSPRMAMLTCAEFLGEKDHAPPWSRARWDSPRHHSKDSSVTSCRDS